MPAAGELSRRLEELGVAADACAFLRRLHRTQRPAELVRQTRWLAAGGLALRRLVRRYDPDLVHAGSTTAALYVLGLPWRLPKPVIWHVRDVSVPAGVGRWLARRCARILVPSRACRKVVEKVADRRKIRLIPNGIEIKRPKAAEIEMRKIAPGEGPLIAVVGQLAPWKGHALAIKVARCIRDRGRAVRVVLIGDDRFGDHPDAADRLARKIRGLGLEEAVHLLGYRSDVRSILAAADLLLHPAYPEPFGRVVVEAMAAGCPVVALAGEHGPAEIVRHGVDGLLVPSRAPAALARAVCDLLDDQPLRRKLGAAARQCATALYDRTLMARRIEAVYDSLTSQCGASGEEAAT